MGRGYRRRLVRWLWAVALVASVTSVAAEIFAWHSASAAPSVGSLPRRIEETNPATVADRRPATEASAPVATHAARAELLPSRQSVPPAVIRLDSLGVEAQVVAVGSDPQTGEMVIPRDPGVIGWYEHGPSPGEAGTAVLAGHVDYAGRPGAFFELTRLEPGASVVVRQLDGTERRFAVVARREFVKSQLPVSELFTREGPPVVALVTCGGRFDEAAHSYEANVVVYAVPSEATQATHPSSGLTTVFARARAT
jgi:hypothetical protein